MPMYYFHVRNGDVYTRDVEGSELPNAGAAMREVRDMAREFAIEDLRHGSGVADNVIEIADVAGASIGSFHVRDILKDAAKV